MQNHLFAKKNLTALLNFEKNGNKSSTEFVTFSFLIQCQSSKKIDERKKKDCESNT